jgi:tRNA C32,U32 (ribose-2'-O)-methylase TrmJ
VKILPVWSDLLSAGETLVAMSAMRGRVSRGLPPSTTFKEVSASLRQARTRVTLVFGPERGGLTTEELQTCDARLRIATDEAFPTLNLAQSVAIALAFLSPLSPLSPFKAPRRSRGTPTPDDPQATAGDVRRFLLSFKEVLSSAGYPGRGRSKEVVREIESFLRRGKPTAREVTLFLGAFAALRRALGVKRPGRPLRAPAP